MELSEIFLLAITIIMGLVAYIFRSNIEEIKSKIFEMEKDYKGITSNLQAEIKTEVTNIKKELSELNTSLRLNEKEDMLNREFIKAEIGDIKTSIKSHNDYVDLQFDKIAAKLEQIVSTTPRKNARTARTKE
jgi:DNA-binding transcriptional regulator GbsR (MarR family)